MGLPCVVGASSLTFNLQKRTLTSANGRVFREGDTLTIDGSSGDVLVGEPAMLEATHDDAFQELMEWSDSVRDIGVRANADTPKDATTARNFGAEGIGLCRTEHMFFEADPADPHARDDLCG